MGWTLTSTTTTSPTRCRCPCCGRWRRRNSSACVPTAPSKRLRRFRPPRGSPPNRPLMKTLICDCNRTMPLDVPALSQALTATPGASPDGLETTHTLLCRREAGAFQRAAKATSEAGEPLLVACTQESRLFVELNAQTEGAASIEERPIRFVNIRETGGWSRDGARATPKIAALLAAAQLPMPAPVPTVSYRSGGRCLIVGTADAAERAAELLADKLDVSLLIDRGGALAQA